MNKHIKKIFTITLILFNLIFLSSSVFATNVSNGSKSYQTVINENQFFISMISEIFSTQDEISNINNDVKFYNTETIINNLTSVAIDGLKKWGESALYYFFLGIGVFILLLKTTVNITQSNYGQEEKTMQQYLRIGITVFVSLIVLLNINNILIGLLGIFRSIYIMSLSYIKNGEIVEIGEQIKFTQSEMIAYNILKSVGADSNSIVDQALNTNGQTMFLTIQYLICWIICVLGKLVLILAIIITEIEILVNGMMYPIAAGDIIDNIQKSSFILYTKKILSALLRILIIIIVMLGTQILLSDFTNDLLKSAAKVYEGGVVSRAKSNEIFSIALIMSAIQAAKSVVATLVSWQISKKLVGDE